MQVAAFVFARGGSKGLPRKNLRLVGGVPLVSRAIHCALECPEIDVVYLSTDDPEIADVGVRTGATVPELRPADLATDDSPESLAWQHAVTWADTPDLPDLECFVSVPPTAPLRRPDDLSAAITLYRAGGCDAVLTGTPSQRHPRFNLYTLTDEGMARPYDDRQPAPVRRQEVSLTFDLTTVAYVLSPQAVRAGTPLSELRSRLHVIPRERAVDIDDEVDLHLANCLLDWEDRDSDAAV